MLAPQQNDIVGDLIREQMAKGIAFRFRVVSDSIAPLIAAGDEVVIGEASVDKLRRGDIVVCAVGDADYDRKYDLDDDGEITVADIQRVVAQWRETCEAP